VASGGDALYDVDRRVLSQLLVVRHGPSILVNRPGFADAVTIDLLESALHAPGNGLGDIYRDDFRSTGIAR